jgi:hypothetical protein
MRLSTITKLNSYLNLIVSGGQTCVDRAALDVAIKHDIPHGGWCPYQRKAEDGIIPITYNLKEALPPQFRNNLTLMLSIKKEPN